MKPSAVGMMPDSSSVRLTWAVGWTHSLVNLGARALGLLPGSALLLSALREAFGVLSSYGRRSVSRASIVTRALSTLAMASTATECCAVVRAAAEARYARYDIVPAYGAAPLRLETRDLGSFFTGGSTTSPSARACSAPAR
jgi:hypothetical protein